MPLINTDIKMKGTSTSREEHVLSIVFLIALFLPHTSNLLLIVNPVICILLSYHYAKIKKFRNDTTKYLLLGSIAFSIMINTLMGAPSAKSIIAACNLFLVLLLFPFVADIRIRNTYVYVALIYIIISQITMVIHVPAISDLFEIAYPLSEESEGYYQYVLSNASSNNISGFRLAGLFRNPNQCSKYVTLITAVFLLDSKTTFIKSLPFLGLASFSILMTGSRTGLVVFMCLVFFSLFLNDKVSRTAKTTSIIVLIGLALFVLYEAADFRGLRVDEGINDSAGAKFGALKDYLSRSTDPFHFLFGHVDQYLFVASSGNIHSSIDCEYGYMIFNYGIVGFAFYIIFFCKLFKGFTKHERLIFVPMLWIISASMLLAFRSLFLYMLLLSKYYIRSKNKKYGVTQ